MNKAFLWTSMLSAALFAALAIPAAHSAPGFPAAQAQQPAEPALNPRTPEPAASTPGETTFDQQVTRWIQTLSQEKGFEAWSGARWDSYPLGPGTHGWLVLVRNGQKEVGYLIVGDAEAGQYRLLEYGSGGKPLFGMETLYQSLIQLGLILEATPFETFRSDMLPSLYADRLYAPPLQAAWKLVLADQTYWLDAKSGEKLPDLEDAFAQAAADQDNGEVTPDLTVTDRLLSEPFDPFERPVWIMGKPLESPAFADIRKRLLAGEQIAFSGKWFGGKVIYPLAVTGYHMWTGNVCYLGFDQEGTRFAPYQAALQLGRLYR